jgi:putative redox protein
LWLGYLEQNAMAITQKTLVPMAVSAECPTHARTSARAGKHEIVIDEPAGRGGTDLGPTPIETMIASLLGCTNVILNRVAEKNHVEVKALSLAAEAGFDRRGVMLEEEVAVPFPEIRLTINLTTSATDLPVERVKADLGRFCPVSKVIRQSGTKLEEIWNITHA